MKDNIMKNLQFQDHYFLTKKDCVIFYNRKRENEYCVVRKGDSFQIIKNQNPRLPLSVCVVWDYKRREWRFHETCADKGMLRWLN